ncbi:MAG: 5-dehydro-2-deoxygluconokinase [Gemmatimonadaceae bacterium]
MNRPEILTIGRIGIDLYPAQSNVPIADVETFAKSVGGTATNVAVGAARLGRRAALATRVGDDPFGAYALLALEGFGVDTRFVGIDSDLPTPITFCELNPPDDPHIIFYRYPKAPDMNLSLVDLDQEVVEDVPILWISGSTLSDEPSRSTVKAVLEARARRRHTILDLDWRPTFWRSHEVGRRELGEALSHVTAAVGNREECEVAVGIGVPKRAADLLLDRGVELAVVKLGGDGVFFATAGGTRAFVPPFPVEVVCGLGAGDAFGGALCHALLAGWRPLRAIRFASAAGAIVASRLLCAPAMPTLAEVLDLREREGQGPRTHEQSC